MPLADIVDYLMLSVVSTWACERGKGVKAAFASC